MRRQFIILTALALEAMSWPLAFSVSLAQETGTEVSADLQARAAKCPSPFVIGAFDSAMRYRYGRYSCRETSEAEKPTLVINFRQRLTDGRVEATSVPADAYVVLADGPTVFRVDTSDDVLYLDNAETGEHKAITSVHDDKGFLVLPDFMRLGDHGIYAWHYVGDFDHRTLWHIDTKGMVRELGPQSVSDDKGYLTLPSQFSAPALTYFTRSERLTRLTRTLDSTVLFDEAFFARYAAVQVSLRGGSEFYASDDGRRVVSSLATGLYEADHPEYPRGQQVVMIDKDRGIRTYKVAPVGNLGTGYSGISPDGEYFFVKTNGGFEIREFWTAREVYTYRPEYTNSGNPGDIIFVDSNRVAMIDGDEAVHLFTFRK